MPYFYEFLFLPQKLIWYPIEILPPFVSCVKEKKKKKLKNVKKQILEEKIKLNLVEDCINSMQFHFTLPGYYLASHIVLSPRE